MAKQTRTIEEILDEIDDRIAIESTAKQQGPGTRAAVSTLRSLKDWIERKQS